MGCDIHIEIQIQDPDGVWRSIAWQAEPYLRDEPDESDADQVVPGIPVAPTTFDSRNYDLFGILNGVRTDHWPQVEHQQGWPEDFHRDQALPDPRMQRWEYPPWPRCLGDHSFMWVTLDQLKAYDWSVKRREYGRLTTASAATWWPKEVLPWLTTLAQGRPLRLIIGFDS